MSAADEGAHRLAACTLIIGAPIGKNKGRMIDGKIENLWLKDEEVTNRLDNIRMLSTLLGYVQKFCGSHQVPHLSSIQTLEHPVWLRNFFKVAGFNRCECLKPETSGQRYRACLQLDSSGNVLEQESADDVSEDRNEKENANLKEKIATKPSAPTVSKDAKAASTAKGKDGPSSIKSMDPILAKPMTETQALEWLSQNQEMLAAHAPSRPLTKSTSDPAMLRAEAATLRSEMASKLLALENGARADKIDNQVGVKRKLAETMNELENGEVLERNTRTRKSQNVNTGDQNTEDGVATTPQQPKAKPEPKPAKAPVARYSSTNAPEPPKPKESQPGANSNMTDALLAQCEKTKSASSPKPIKKEAAPAARTEVSPSPDSHSRLPVNYPSGNLTCFYWANQGGCKYRDEDCMYAHHYTGSVARPPSIYKKGKVMSSFYDVNGISIKGSNSGTTTANGPAAPTGPKAGADGPYESSRPWDSWRP